MKCNICLLLLIACLPFNRSLYANKNIHPLSTFYFSDDPNIQYTGRVDFSNPKRPRFWVPGVYITAIFKGSFCSFVINDEVLHGNLHNYIEVVIDDTKFFRIKTKTKTDTIDVAKGLSEGNHSITICKNTESGTGYLEFVGFICENISPLTPKPNRKIECIGNSITCGTGSDLSEIPCGAGEWHDQHNAYMSYGAVTARNLHAQWHLSSVSGIGLTHSCCGLKIIMPQVFDKINMRSDSILWDFNKYQPDVVTICLGQNDGIQDSAFFCNAYVEFIKTVRSIYSNAHIICLTSPMANEKLNAAQRKYLEAVTSFINAQGDKKVSSYFFSKRYYHGCDSHPNLEEHKQIAEELTAYIKTVMNW